MGKEQPETLTGDLATVGGRLRAAREHRKVKNPRRLWALIAETTGKTYAPSYPGQIEKGSKNAGRGFLRDAATALRVRPQWLEYGAGDPFEAQQSDLDLDAQAFVETIAGEVNDLTPAQRLQVSHLVTQMAAATRLQREQEQRSDRDSLIERLRELGVAQSTIDAALRPQDDLDEDQDRASGED